MDIICPSCNSNHIVCIGRIPQTNIFAGNKLTISLPNSNLYKCRGCNLYFKWPRLNKQQLDMLYRNGNPKIWQYDLRDRKDWQIAKNWITRKVNKGSILDVGCWDGGFLQNLNGYYNLYGVEINPFAAKRAQAKGIQIIADNISEIKCFPFNFDVITAFDLIEHVEYPLNFIASLTQITKKDGYIIISSGNTDSITWKISGSRYWYCALPEHMSFTNFKWYRYMAKKLNLEIVYYEKFSHRDLDKNIRKMLTLSKDFIFNLIYLISPTLLINLRKIKNNIVLKNKQDISYGPPSWSTAKDHLIIILLKT